MVAASPEPVRHSAILMIFALFASLTGCKSVSLVNAKYYGKPVKAGPQPGCEGCAQPGQFEFGKDRVSFVLPGSDEKNSGVYKISGSEISINGLHGKTHKLVIKEKGKVLSFEGDDFRRSDYPWPP